MAKKKNKKMPEIQEEIAKWAAIGAWSVPASELIKAIKMVIKHFLK